MSSSISRRAGRSAAALVASAVTLSAINLVTAGAAHADTQSAADGATATVADVVSSGSAIHISGTGWQTAAGDGSTIAVKLGDALATEPKSGPVTNPATGTSADAFDIWAAVEAEDDGTFSADIPFPTPDNTNPALPSAWTVGSTHTLRLLTGSMESGDKPRGLLLTFTVGAGLVSSATTAATGAVTVAFSGGVFPVGEVLSVKQGDVARQWTTTSGRTSTTAPTYTVPAAGTLTASVALPAGSAPAGNVTLTITGDKGTSRTVTAVAPPAVAFDPGAMLGTTGKVTVGNLAPGAQLASVALGGTTLGTDLTADADGKVKVDYSIPAAAATSLNLVVTQSSPSAQTWTLPQTVYPNELASGTGRFTLTSTTADQGFYQGFYQSAYSAKEDALYVTASDRGTGNGGYLYKLDPLTLAIEKSYEFVDIDDNTKTGGFGVGVDDVHGTVWVTNTGSATVAVYSEDDLSLVKQLPLNTITHPRDVVFDPATDLVFVSSASESSSTTANGYISVFEADDKDGDGVKYEKVTDIQTGTRAEFNPVSLSLDGGVLVSPSLQGNKVVKITTADVLKDGYTPEFIQVEGLNGVNGTRGSGGSGIAYDADNNRIYVASQSGNEVVVADATTGAAIKEAPTGRGALNVVIDHVHGLVYVANLSGTSVTVLDLDGNKVAALPIASANHVSVDGKGNAFVVDKAAANRAWRITPHIEAIGGTELLNPTASGPAGTVATTPLAVDATYGEDIHLEGTSFLTADGTSGSTLAVKLDSAGASVHSIEADEDGAWTLDLPVPADWTPGGDHHLRLLSGSLKTGDTLRSIAVKVNVTQAGTTAGTAAITGSARVGQKLEATTVGWATGTAFTYAWQRGGAAITGATNASYTATPADLGKKLTVVVTGALTGHDTVTATSAAVTVAAGTLTTATPKVSGTVAVGQKLTATAGTWTTGTKLAFQWKRNGATIAGATASSYTLTPTDLGRTITVTVTGSLTGYTTAAKTSTATGAVKAAALKTATPTISGTVAVGRTLTAKAGTWTSGATLSYQWKRSGKTISGATRSTYALTTSDKGKAITVTVTGKKAGYATTSVTSKATAAVKAGTLTKATPKISGTAKVGKTLKVKAGTWTTGTTLTYRWYANGKAISGKTGTSLTLTSSLGGKKITVTVTGKKSGYTTAATSSKATAKVKK